MSQRARVWPVALSLVCVVTAHATSQEIRPGVWAAQEPQTLPLPVGGYSAYLVGELHGIQENAAFQLRYLMQLRAASGVRDVAIEEDAVYEEDAAAFVNGDSKVLPEPLCVHADIFDSIRRLNAGLEPDARIRVHLTDIDSPASAIRRHLADLQQRLHADRVRIPDVTEIKRLGLEAVAQLSQLPMDAATRAGLRTVAFSIQAYQQGLEIGLGAPHGSPYLDAREEAVADNILDLVRGVNSRPLLVLYGSDHVSRAARKDGGPDRNQPFAPMALRLKQAGVNAFSVVTFPLAGRSFWRGRPYAFDWTAIDGHLSSGETLDAIWTAAPSAEFLYIDPTRERVSLPSQDLIKMTVDAFLLLRSGTPLRNRCGA